MSIPIYTPSEVRRLPGVVQTINDRLYPLSGAKARAKGTVPKDCLPKGHMVLEKREALSDSGRRCDRYYVLWHVPVDPQHEGPTNGTV